MRRFLILSALVVNGLCAVHAQYKVEYFYDADPGYGKAKQMSVDIGTNDLLLSTENLSEGFHMLSIRSVDDEGRWSPTVSQPLFVTNDLVSAGVDKLEYFFDTDPGYGNAKRLAVNEGSNVVFFSTDGLSEGMHLLGVRSQYKDGRWSPVVSSPVYVVCSKEFDAVEWFVDTDPGEGLANNLALGEEVINFSVPTGNMSIGSHTLVLRARMAGNGNWVVISETPFSVVENTGVASVTIDMDVNISCEDGKLHLSSSDYMDATVEIFGMDGKMLHNKQWDKGTKKMTINVSNYASSLIIKVQRKDGKRIIRKVSQ